MGEYHCYEFVALERPLTPKQMAALRALSTRAEISPTRFWNEYHWGDLKADPQKLMERHFDAHLYFSSLSRTLHSASSCSVRSAPRSRASALLHRVRSARCERWRSRTE